MSAWHHPDCKELCCVSPNLTPKWSAGRTVHKPKSQDDIREMVQKWDEYQRHGDKTPRPLERQISAPRLLELLGVDVAQFQRQRALVTVDYYSGFLTYDTISSETTEAVTKALDNIFRKLGLPERIISDNGSCFKSEKFQCVLWPAWHWPCNFQSIPSSEYWWSGEGNRYSWTDSLKKSAIDTDIPKNLKTYLDTPISGSLLSPA